MKEKWRIVFTLLMLIVNIPLPLMLYYNNSSLFIILCSLVFQYLFIGVLMKLATLNDLSNKEGNKLMFLWLFALWNDKVIDYVVK